MGLRNTFTSFFEFSIATLTRKRRVRIVQNDDVPLGDVGLAFSSGLWGEKVRSALYSSLTVGLNGVIQG